MAIVWGLWLDDRKFFAMALDRDKTAVDGIGSNIGHCLWTGIVDDHKAPYVARTLVGSTMFSGWGIRTLSTDMSGFNPIGYHSGSVWPHDTAVCAAGLARYGFVDEASTVLTGMFDAATFDDGRLPELFSGLDRSELSSPVSFPASCSPQAWSAGAALLALRTLLGFNPDLPNGRLYIAGKAANGIQHLRIERLMLGGRAISIELHDGEVRIDGLDSSVQVVRVPNGVEK